MVCTIAVIHAGGERYYLHLAREDYYTQGGEKPGRALGKGAEVVGLTSAIVDGDKRVRALFRGINPMDSSVLRKGAQMERIYRDGEGREHVSKPVAAYDFTLSVDKTVSVLWGVSDRETQQTISRAIDRAADNVAAYIDKHFCYTRVRNANGDIEREKVSPIFLAFEHSTSRQLDPQKHIHLLLVNAGIRGNGRGGAIDAKAFLRPHSPHRARLTDIFHQEVKVGLERELGVKTYHNHLPEGRSVAIAGVPPSLTQHLSKRRQEIEKQVLPGDTSKQVQLKVLSTRPQKVSDVKQEELFSQWRSAARKFGFDYREVIDRDTRKLRSDESERLRSAKQNDDWSESEKLKQESPDSERQKLQQTFETKPSKTAGQQSVQPSLKTIAHSGSLNVTSDVPSHKRQQPRKPLSPPVVPVSPPVFPRHVERERSPQTMTQSSAPKFERQRFASFIEQRLQKRQQRQSRPLPPRRPLSDREVQERLVSLNLLKSMTELHQNKARQSYEAGVDRAFKKARHQHQLRQKWYQRKQLFLYVRGRISHAQYVRNTQEERGLMRTKFGIYLAYATHRISRKQQRYLLSKYGHTKKFEGQPRTRFGINLAYATYKITSHQRLSLLHHHKLLRAKDVQTLGERAEALRQKGGRGVDLMQEKVWQMSEQLMESRQAKKQQGSSSRLAAKAKKRKRKQRR